MDFLKKYAVQIALGLSVVLCGAGLYSMQTEQDFGAVITTINGSDKLSDSRSVINTNFANLNTDLVALQATVTGLSFPFTATSYGVSTSTTVGFTNGILSTASSTFSSALRLSSLSSGGVGIGTGGLLYSAATTTYSSPLVYTSGAVTCPTCQTSAGTFPFDAITNWGITFAAGTTSRMYINNAGFPSFFAVNASSTALSATTLAVGGTATTSFAANGRVTGVDSTNVYVGVTSPTRYIALMTGTTTTWTASTTATAYSPFMVMPFAGTLRDARCSTDASFLGVNIKIESTSVTPTYFVASTTEGLIKTTANNTFSIGNIITIDFGTTTTATTKAASCTLGVTETP